jgi:PhnB protein
MSQTASADVLGALTPYIIVKGAARAIEFYSQAFGAREIYRLCEPGNGKVGHAELAIGTGKLMLADEYPDWGALSPASLGGTAFSLHLYVADVDAAVRHASSCGATVLRAASRGVMRERRQAIIRPLP